MSTPSRILIRNKISRSWSVDGISGKSITGIISIDFNFQNAFKINLLNSETKQVY